MTTNRGSNQSDDRMDNNRGVAGSAEDPSGSDNGYANQGSTSNRDQDETDRA